MMMFGAIILSLATAQESAQCAETKSLFNGTDFTDCFSMTSVSAGWNDDFLNNICSSYGDTIKNTTAQICTGNAAGDVANAILANGGISGAGWQTVVHNFKLAMINTMYGTSHIPEGSACNYYCMYNPQMLVGAAAGGPGLQAWLWKTAGGVAEMAPGEFPDGCWQLMDWWTCYQVGEAEWRYQQTKMENLCPGSLCSGYGDPHIHMLNGLELEAARYIIGDYVFYHSASLRVDVRLREFHTGTGDIWAGVTGIHATAVQIVNSARTCDMLLEVFNAEQDTSGYGATTFLVNGVETLWGDLEAALGQCEHVCSSMSHVNETTEEIMLYYDTQQALLLRNVNNMHAIYLTAPTEDLVSLELSENDQLCSGDMNKTDCENYKTIFTRADLKSVNPPEYHTCEDVIDFTSTPTTSPSCPPELEEYLKGKCKCQGVCYNEATDIALASCEFDLCMHPGVNVNWPANQAQVDLIIEDIKKTYCDDQSSLTDQQPHTCKDEDATCAPYNNDVADINFIGVGDDCRMGIKYSWPGHKTCASPYLVCLPQENTPVYTLSDTHRYTVDECKAECARDQRCMGMEFVAEAGGVLGNCTLVDDVPVEITNYIPVEFPIDFTTDTDLSNEGAPALCFAKQNYCNPHFQAEDLSDVMLNCYCPNNRKGTYTKKVERLVETSRYCGEAPDYNGPQTERIKFAQANRMFHLCENWCIFNVFEPNTESWYYDPWVRCWREQFSGYGTSHQTYCYNVIRDPYTVEIQYINYRSSMFCGQSAKPTFAPVTLDQNSGSWYLADEHESCTEKCTAESKTCDENLTASLTMPTDLVTPFQSVNIDCQSYVFGQMGWALPGYQNSTGTCLSRDPKTDNYAGMGDPPYGVTAPEASLQTTCSNKVGVGYQRLCNCYDDI